MVAKTAKKTVVKKIAKTIKPKPKPKVRRAQGQPAPGTRVGTTQNPASKSVTKTTAKRTTAKRTTPASKAAVVAPKKDSFIPKGRGKGIIGAAAGLTGLTLLERSKKNKGESFDDAFRKARAKGEATLFTHNGKKYTAVTKDDLKRKGYSTLAAYNKAGGAKKVTANKSTDTKKKRKRPVINAVKRVLLGKDKKFGGDKGLIDFIRKPKKKADGGMMKYKDGGSVSSKRSSSRRGVGAAKRGFGKALK